MLLIYSWAVIACPLPVADSLKSIGSWGPCPWLQVTLAPSVGVGARDAVGPLGGSRLDLHLAVAGAAPSWGLSMCLYICSVLYAELSTSWIHKLKYFPSLYPRKLLRLDIGID